MANRIKDLHTHILFGIDDGAKDLHESLEMAKLWVKEGVTSLVASPHFDIKKDNQEEFLKTRDTNLKILRDELAEQKIDLEVLVSAELYFRSDLVYQDLSPFLIEGTNYLLIELPTRTVPPRIKQTFEELLIQGYNPILVHIERYSILKEDLTLFYELAEMGVLFQVNAETLLKDHESWLKTAIKHDYVHLIASDAHNTKKRKPNISKALKQSKGHDYYNDNAARIINNEVLNTPKVKRIKKLFNKYY